MAVVSEALKVNIQRKHGGVDDVDAPGLHIWVRVDCDCFTVLEDMTCPFHPSAVKQLVNTDLNGAGVLEGVAPPPQTSRKARSCWRGRRC